ncbi:MAG: SDR family oxidoreductase [Myxococcales bacterium]|nr:SDR family oxidoreductase [Myxococcales bacterium]
MSDARWPAVVTGAGRGIGRAIALELARRGHPVVLQARTRDQLEGTLAEIRDLGGRAALVPGDVRFPEASAGLVATCTEAFGPPAIAVAAAGRALSVPVLSTRPEDLTELFDVNVLGTFHLLVAAGRAMQERKHGRFVAIASTAAVKPAKYIGAYAASKHAVVGLVRSAAIELAPLGITVNAVCPGWVETSLLEDSLKNIAAKTGRSEDDARSALRSRVPAGRFCSPEEVASLVAYLVSDEARHVTGQTLVIDGGESIA